MNTLLTVTDLAQRLNVSRRTLYRMLDSGQLCKPITLRGAKRFDPNVVDQWIAAGAPHVRRTGWIPSDDKGRNTGKGRS